MTYCTPTTYQTARKEHICTNCCGKILKGETYARWASFDDTGFTNKMHMECLDSFLEDNEGRSFEYTPYCGERPEKKGADKSIES